MPALSCSLGLQCLHHNPLLFPMLPMKEAEGSPSLQVGHPAGSGKEPIPHPWVQHASFLWSLKFTVNVWAFSTGRAPQETAQLSVIRDRLG